MSAPQYHRGRPIMISEEEALQRLRPILAEILVLNPEEVQPDARLVDDLDADSIAFLELNYRLEHNFGLQVPRPKVTEEMLSRPLLEELTQSGAAGIEPTLLEYLTGEMLHHARQDPQVYALLVEQFRRSLGSPEFKADLRAALQRCRDDEALRRALGSLGNALRRTPGLAPALDQVLAEDVELAAAWRALPAGAEVEPGAKDGSEELSALWPKLFRDAPMRRSLTDITAGQLARLMGTSLPAGLPSDLVVGRLRVRDLFRFITVGSYVRYIVFLSRAQAGRQPNDVEGGA
jgi:acyl carrier protein